MLTKNMQNKITLWLFCTFPLNPELLSTCLILIRALHTALFLVYSKELLSIVFNGFGPAAPRRSQVGPSCFTLFELQILV